MYLPRRYVASLLATVCLVLVAVACFTIAVDPYYFWGVPGRAGFNLRRPKALDAARLAKSYMAGRLAPEVLILGSSRTETGIRPDHPIFGGRRVFNHALSSPATVELRGIAGRGVRDWPVSDLLIGLDFFYFNALLSTRAGFDARRTASPPERRAAWRNDAGNVVLSVDAMRAAWRTVADQDTISSWLLPDGRRYRARPQRQHRQFLWNETTYLVDGWFPVDTMRAFWLSDSAGVAGEEPLADLARLLEACSRPGVRLRLFVSPIHVRMLVALEAAGLWDGYEAWKRALVVEVESARSHCRPEAIELWDFGDVNAITTEAVPALDDSMTTMRWYYEGSHYTPATGDLVLERIYGGKLPRAARGFGIMLDATSLEGQLAATRAALAEWKAGHPRDVAEVDSLAAAADGVWAERLGPPGHPADAAGPKARVRRPQRR